eukprot:scpid26798/ scgid10953/ Protein phosphatase 1 regulatory inhibitor subunit 16B; CAAX box protein TIMAP; TGF-beta-inhibited membrane-associated protein
MSLECERAQPVAGSADNLCSSLPSSTPVQQCKIQLRQAVKEGSLAETEICLMQLADQQAIVRDELKCLDDEGLTVLHQAIFVRQGLALLQLLVRHGGDIGVRDEEGCTLLHTAAMVSSTSIACWLINEGANLAALDKEGHLPMDRCEDPLLQDVIFQAMARAGLVGLAMPNPLTWIGRSEDLCDRAGDSDYGTSSSVGSLSEDEDRLSLHSTQSFSSTDEGTVDSESPLHDSGSRTGRSSYERDERTGSPALLPLRAQLVRVIEVDDVSRIRGATVHHVQYDCVISKERKVVPVIRRSGAGHQQLRQVEHVFISDSSIDSTPDSCSGRDQPVAQRCGPAEAANDNQVVGDPSSQGLDSRADRPSCLHQCPCGEQVSLEGNWLANTPVASIGTCSATSSSSEDISADVQPAAASAAAASREQETAPCVVAEAPPPRRLEQQQQKSQSQETLVESLVDEDEEQYLAEDLACGSSSDETIHAAESDAESIAAEVLARASSFSSLFSCDDTLHQLVSCSLESVNISHSQHNTSYSTWRNDGDVANDLPATFACDRFVQESTLNRQRLLSSVESVGLTSASDLSATSSHTVAADDNKSIALDSPCQKHKTDASGHDVEEEQQAVTSCVNASEDNEDSQEDEDNTQEPAPRSTHPTSTTAAMEAVRRRVGVVHYPTNHTTTKPMTSTNYPISSLGKRGPYARHQVLSSDYLGTGKAISRRNTVSEVDMGWVAPARQVKPNKPSTQGKPLKSLLRQASVSEYDTSSKARGAGSDAASTGTRASKLARKKSVSFPAEVLLADAIHDGDIEEVRGLLVSGAIAADALLDNGLTPLHSAVLERQREIVKLLLARGARVEQRDSDGWTALHAAATEGTVPVTHLLLENGADPWTKTKKEKKTAYELASNDNVRLVLSKAMGDAYRSIQLVPSSAADADVDTDSDSDNCDGEDDSDLDAESEEEEDYVRSRESDVEDNNSEAHDDDGDGDDMEDESAGAAASAADSLPRKAADKQELVRSLVDAISQHDSAKVDLLLEDATPSDVAYEVEDDGCTLLHIAARSGHVDIIEKLLDFGLKPFFVDDNDQSPLDVATSDQVKLVLRKAMSRQNTRRTYSTAL